ncbi:Alpha/Beta hydrolase protein [Pelagophyceae sp. CCMP2097]|nr:Alpha/Beta hydrolase protein [Pelagophyceae sp. CCMP2097]
MTIVIGLVHLLLLCGIGAMTPSTGAMTATPRARVRPSLGRELVGSVAMPAIIGSLLVASIVQKDVEDIEGFVARKVPTDLAHAVRDSRLAWKIFTVFQSLGGLAAVTARVVEDRGLPWTAVLRELFAAYGAASDKTTRVTLDDSVSVEMVRHGDRSSASDSSSKGACVLFVPGGAWSSGDDARLWRVFAHNVLVQNEGVSAVGIVEYAPYPLFDGAGMCAAVADALQWALADATASEFAYEVDEVIVVGQSAGAHLAAVALLDDAAARHPRAALLCSGAYDLDAHVAHESFRGVVHVSALSAAFPVADHPTFSPTVLAREARTAPPVRISLFHGDSDRTVPPTSTSAFFTELEALKERVDVPLFSVESHTLEHTGHLEYMLAASTPRACGGELFRCINALVGDPR